MQVFHNQRRAATVEITLRSKHAHNSYKAVPGGQAAQAAKPERIQAALRVLGKRIVVGFEDAA